MLSKNYTRLSAEDINRINDICGYTYDKCKPYFTNTRTALDIGCKAGNFAKHIQKDFEFVHMFDMFAHCVHVGVYHTLDGLYFFLAPS